MSENKGAPHQQGFNVKGVKNKSKTRAWFQTGTSNNGSKKRDGK